MKADSRKNIVMTDRHAVQIISRRHRPVLGSACKLDMNLLALCVCVACLPLAPALAPALALAAVLDVVQISCLPLALAPAIYKRCMHQLVSAFMDAYQLVLVHINLPQYIRKQAGGWAQALAQLCH